MRIIKKTLDASEEARGCFLLKCGGSLMLQMVDGNAKWIYQPPWWLFPPRVPNIANRWAPPHDEIGGCHAELGSYEAHVEGMR